jgi:hypothetical protein
LEIRGASLLDGVAGGIMSTRSWTTTNRAAAMGTMSWTTMTRAAAMEKVLSDNDQNRIAGDEV